MRVALISDVHGNLEALQSTLTAIDAAGVDECWSLGDVVGYGARPAACMALLRDYCSVLLSGNHDLVAAGVDSVEGFSRSARIAISWTSQQLTPDERAELAGWPSTIERVGIGLAHASMRDPVWEYVVEPEIALANLELQQQQIVAIGHSHRALSWRLDETMQAGASGALRTHGDTQEFGEDRWIFNPGSVGQPRDRDPRSGWLELDLSRGLATWHRVAYDIVAAQASIRAAGLPGPLAERLGAGL